MTYSNYHVHRWRYLRTDTPQAGAIVDIDYTQFRDESQLNLEFIGRIPYEWDRKLFSLNGIEDSGNGTADRQD